MFNKGLSYYCSRFPYLESITIRAKLFLRLRFWTRCLPCFTLLHTLFYENGVKVIPEIIYDLLTPVALAHWIISEGYWEG